MGEQNKTFTWSGLRGLTGYTEARYRKCVGTVRRSFETIPAGLDHITGAETWSPALPDPAEIFDSSTVVQP
jgi:hypothetical protein